MLKNWRQEADHPDKCFFPRKKTSQAHEKNIKTHLVSVKRIQKVSCKYFWRKPSPENIENFNTSPQQNTERSNQSATTLKMKRKQNESKSKRDPKTKPYVY